MATALLLIDLQNDFLPGGALAVPDGDAVVPIANELMGRHDFVVATQDWHPPDHLSFASQHEGKRPGDIVDLDGLEQVLWPDHCVQGSRGAELAPRLGQDGINEIVQKGKDRRVDSYSGFFDNARRRATGLEEVLRARRIDEVHLVGLATDYCVKFTALDAVDLGFRTVVLRDAVRGVDLAAGDCERAIAAMREAGVEVR